MNLKLYGICFKLRGGPDLLDYVQTNRPVPVDMMEQVMNEVSSIKVDEIEFAKKLDNDWKKAFNERVPLLIGTTADGGYDISCVVPDELLGMVRMFTGMSDEKIIEEYVSSHLKDVLGIEAPIERVDVEERSVLPPVAVAPAPQGFDLSDLDAVPDTPAMEDVSDVDVESAFTATVHTAPAEEPVFEEPAFEEEPYDELEPVEAFDEDVIPDEEFPVDDEVPTDDEVSVEDEIPMEDEVPVEDEIPKEDEVPDEESAEAVSDNNVGEALTNIYTELVGNIREKKLDERLGLKIGQ